MERVVVHRVMAPTFECEYCQTRAEFIAVTDDGESADPSTQLTINICRWHVKEWADTQVTRLIDGE